MRLSVLVLHLPRDNATVNRDEGSEPLDFPEAVPRPGDEPKAGPAQFFL